jgi:hypothetical protein
LIVVTRVGELHQLLNEFGREITVFRNSNTTCKDLFQMSSQTHRFRITGPQGKATAPLLFSQPRKQRGSIGRLLNQNRCTRKALGHFSHRACQVLEIASLAKLFNEKKGDAV